MMMEKQLLDADAVKNVEAPNNAASMAFRQMLEAGIYELRPMADDTAKDAFQSQHGTAP